MQDKEKRGIDVKQQREWHTSFEIIRGAKERDGWWREEVWDWDEDEDDWAARKTSVRGREGGRDRGMSDWGTSEWWVKWRDNGDGETLGIALHLLSEKWRKGGKKRWGRGKTGKQDSRYCSFPLCDHEAKDWFSTAEDLLNKMKLIRKKTPKQNKNKLSTVLMQSLINLIKSVEE